MLKELVNILTTLIKGSVYLRFHHVKARLW